ncbi:MAG TPA: hypothetical protein VJR95_01395, partial [Rhodanobacter sp.]|nr:hypothetical protein [Rhodanobacter sp.]
MSRLLPKTAFALSLCAGTALAAATIPPAMTANVTAERIGDGIAAFLPPGVTTYPHSLALLRTPEAKGALPAGWAIRPRYDRHDGKTRVTVPVPQGADLYGTGEVTGPLLRNGQQITLWNTDNFEYAKDDGKRLYQSHPWVLGVRPDGSAFGVLFDSTWRATLATGSDIV